jgi:hypothetical protein
LFLLHYINLSFILEEPTVPKHEYALSFVMLRKSIHLEPLPACRTLLRFWGSGYVKGQTDVSPVSIKLEYSNGRITNVVFYVYREMRGSLWQSTECVFNLYKSTD